MFFPVDAPLEEACAELRALRRSLNSPVVTLDGLPVGPASAAIALHPGPQDQPRVTIAIRSLSGRQVAFYGADPERAGFPSSGVAVDAALSFAESMGFLFDDDEVEALGDDGPRRAGAIFCEFASPRPGGVREAEPPPAELLLEEVAESPQVAPARPMAEPAPEIIEPEPLPAALLRRAPEPEPEPEPELEPDLEPEPVAARATAIELEPDIDAEPDLELDPDLDLDPEPDRDLESELEEEPPPLLMTKFRRAAASLAAEAAPDARIRLLSRF